CGEVWLVAPQAGPWLGKARARPCRGSLDGSVDQRLGILRKPPAGVVVPYRPPQSARVPTVEDRVADRAGAQVAQRPCDRAQLADGPRVIEPDGLRRGVQERV